MRRVWILVPMLLTACGDDPSRESPVQSKPEKMYAVNVETWKVHRGAVPEEGKYWLGMIRDGRAFVDTSGTGFVEVTAQPLTGAKPAQDTDPVLGDTTLDGLVDRRDLYYLFTLLIIHESTIAWVTGDIDRDGITDWIDLSLLASFMYGLHGSDNPYRIGAPLSSFATPSPKDGRDGSTPELALGLDLNSSATGVLEANHPHYYQISVVEQGMLSIFTTGNTDTQGRLMHEDLDEIAHNDDQATGNRNFHLSSFTLPGTYYLRINGYGSTEGPYSLHAEFEPRPSAPGYNIDLVYMDRFTARERADRASRAHMARSHPERRT